MIEQTFNQIILQIEHEGSQALRGQDLSGINKGQFDQLKTALGQDKEGNTQLSHLNLTGVRLAGLNLQGFNFASTNLTNADLSGSDISGVDLTHADLTGANLTGVTYNAKTKWPDNYTLPPKTVIIPEVPGSGTEQEINTPQPTFVNLPTDVAQPIARTMQIVNEEEEEEEELSPLLDNDATELFDTTKNELTEAFYTTFMTTPITVYGARFSSIVDALHHFMDKLAGNNPQPTPEGILHELALCLMLQEKTLGAALLKAEENHIAIPASCHKDWKDVTDLDISQLLQKLTWVRRKYAMEYLNPSYPGTYAFSPEYENYLNNEKNEVKKREFWTGIAKTTPPTQNPSELVTVISENNPAATQDGEQPAPRNYDLRIEDLTNLPAYLKDKNYEVVQSDDQSHTIIKVSPDDEKSNVLLWDDGKITCAKPIKDSFEVMAARLADGAHLDNDIITISSGKPQDRMELAKACEALDLKVEIVLDDISYDLQGFTEFVKQGEKKETTASPTPPPGQQGIFKKPVVPDPANKDPMPEIYKPPGISK